MSADISNATIMEALGELNGEMKAEFRAIRTELVAVKEQTTKTNGRVNDLERRASNEDAVKIALEKAKGDQMPTIQHAEQVIMEKGWTTREKALIGFITTLLAIVTYILGIRGL